MLVLEATPEVLLPLGIKASQSLSASQLLPLPDFHKAAGFLGEAEEELDTPWFRICRSDVDVDRPTSQSA